MALSNLAAIVHLKTDYETWETAFLANEDNQDRVNAGDYLYGKANDNTAIVIMKNADMAAMQARMADPEFAKLIENIVDKHEMFTLQEIQRPQ